MARTDPIYRDAERYRWLRAGRYPIEFARSVLNDTPHGIDAAVDAAMKNTDSAGRAYWVVKPGESLPHDAPSGGKGGAAVTSRPAGGMPATNTSGAIAPSAEPQPQRNGDAK